ncbi:adenosylcobinamide-GDP ribazoletransferase [Myroides sp. LJL115]
MIKKQLLYFLTALMFFTRIPISKNLPYSPEILNQSQKYYSLVGIVVGCFNALVFLALQLILPLDVSLLIMMGCSVLLTGAFHEDGFTDVCDSFGGGYGKEKILSIMKDSRIGAYGVIGIVLLLAIKFTSMVHLASIDVVYFALILIAAHSASRFFSGLMIYTHTYVRDIDQSKSKPMASKALPKGNLLISLAIVLLPFVFFFNPIFLLALPFGYGAYAYLGWYFNKHIGGYTGDCLGTVQQLSEVMIYIGFLVIWKFM